MSRRIADIYLGPWSGDAAAAKPQSMSPQPDSASLEGRTGVYVAREDGDRVYRIRLEGGRLQGGLGADGGGNELEAIAQDRFRFIKYPQTELVFQAGANGASAELTTFIDGKKQYRYARAPSFEPTAAQLQEYAGIYRSDEVDMPQQVMVRDGRLVMRSLKSPDLPLLPISTDLFYGRGNRLRFTRDAQGKVTGALFNTFRVLNFRFERPS